MIVRVRPFNRRELDLRTPSIIDIQASSIIIRSSSDDADKKSTKSFSFDHCFDSKEEHGVGQGEVFEALGLGILDNAFKGMIHEFNCSVQGRIQPQEFVRGRGGLHFFSFQRGLNPVK